MKGYTLKHKAYFEFLKQKAEIEWVVKNEDEYTSLFHQSIKVRRIQNHT